MYIQYIIIHLYMYMYIVYTLHQGGSRLSVCSYAHMYMYNVYASFSHLSLFQQSHLAGYMSGEVCMWMCSWFLPTCTVCIYWCWIVEVVA